MFLFSQFYVLIWRVGGVTSSVEGFTRTCSISHPQPHRLTQSSKCLLLRFRMSSNWMVQLATKSS